MKKAIFILVVGVLSATLYSCSPSELEVVSPIVSKVDNVNRDGETVGEDGTVGEEEDGSGNRDGETVGEDGTVGEEEDGSGNRDGETVGEDGTVGEEEDGTGK